MSDSLTDMVDELRVQRPRDARWYATAGTLVRALPTIERRWATVMLLANDQVLEQPGRCLSQTFWELAPALLRPDDAEQMQARAKQMETQGDVEARELDEWDRWTNPWTELQGEG